MPLQNTTQTRTSSMPLVVLCLLGFVLRGCATSSNTQALPGMVTVTGTADLQGNADLPPRAILQVRLVNAKLAGSDESQLRPGLEILAESIAYPGSQRPFAFTLEVPAVLFEEGGEYEIRAELYVGPTLAFAARKTVKVNVRRDLTGVKLVMAPTKP